MKNKTAINDTLSWIKKFKDMNGEYPTGMEIETQLVMQLPKERETITKAFHVGSCNGLWGEKSSEYFTKTYEQ